MPLNYQVTTQIIKSQGQSIRLDAALAKLAEVSKNQASRWTQAGWVKLNGQKAAKGDMVDLGDVISLHPAAFSPAPDPQVPIQVVHRGDGYLVVSKPAGVAVLPKPGDTGGSLIHGLIAHEPETANWAELWKSDLAAAHRLDTPTSGLMIFCTNAESHAAFRQHWDEVEKTYWAQVGPDWQFEGLLTADLQVGQQKPAKVKVKNLCLTSVNDAPKTKVKSPPCPPGWWRCQQTIAIHRQSTKQTQTTQTTNPTTTRYATTLAITLHTGFLHQIRATLAAAGFPILGENHYQTPNVDIQKKKTNKEEQRLFLHAWRLKSTRFNLDIKDNSPDFDCF